MTLKSKSTGEHLAVIKNLIQEVEDLDASLSKEKRESTHGIENEELINGLNSQAKECFNRIIQIKDEIEGMEIDNRVINVRHIEHRLMRKRILLVSMLRNMVERKIKMNLNRLVQL